MFGDFLVDFKLFLQRLSLVGFANVLIGLSSIILLPILVKHISIIDYGVYVQIYVTTNLVPTFATLGLSYAMVRYLSTIKDKKELQEGFYSITLLTAAVSLIVSLIFFIFSTQISIIFNNDIYVTKVVSIIIFVSCLNYLIMNYFRAIQKIKKYSLFLLGSSYIKFIIIAYLAVSNYGILGITIGYLLGELLLFFIMFTFILIDIGFAIPKFKNIKEYISLSYPTIPGNLSRWILNSSDRFIIGIFLGSAAVGYYSPSYTLGNVIFMISSPFTYMLLSELPQHFDKNRIDDVKSYINKSIKYFLLLAIPSFFGLSLLSKSILILLTTKEVALNGYYITPFVALSFLLYGFYGIIYNIFLLEKKTKIPAVVFLISAPLNIILNIILVPIIGIIGAAITTLIGYSLITFLTVHYSLIYLKYDFNIKFIYKSLISSVIMSLVLIYFPVNGVLSLISVIGISILVYLISLYLLKGIDKKEINFIKNLMRNI